MDGTNTNANANANPTSTSTSTATVADPTPVAASSSPSALGPVSAALFLAALAAAALVMAKRRRAVPRLVHIVESASLGPKRSLVVARLGDELFVLGSSEGGISLLATRPTPAALAAVEDPSPLPSPRARGEGDPKGAPARGRGEGLLARLHFRAQEAPAPAFEALLGESLEDAELRRKLAAGQRGSVP
jgi:flagellar protein FliO/FliZ